MYYFCLEINPIVDIMGITFKANAQAQVSSSK